MEFILVCMDDVKYVQKIYSSNTSIFLFRDLLTNKNFFIKLTKRSKLLKDYYKHCDDIFRGEENNKKFYISITKSSVYLDQQLYNNARIIQGKRLETLKRDFPEYFI